MFTSGPCHPPPSSRGWTGFIFENIERLRLREEETLGSLQHRAAARGLVAALDQHTHGSHSGSSMCWEPMGQAGATSVSLTASADEESVASPLDVLLEGALPG